MFVVGQSELVVAPLCTIRIYKEMLTDPDCLTRLLSNSPTRWLQHRQAGVCTCTDRCVNVHRQVCARAQTYFQLWSLFGVWNVFSCVSRWIVYYQSFRVLQFSTSGVRAGRPVIRRWLVWIPGSMLKHHWARYQTSTCSWRGGLRLQGVTVSHSSSADEQS